LEGPISAICGLVWEVFEVRVQSELVINGGCMNYYLLSWEQTSIGTVAFAPDDSKFGGELIRELDGRNEMPFELSLRKVIEGDSGLIYANDFHDLKELFKDYQPNSLAWPLMSVKLRDIFIQNMTGNEGVTWITCTVNATQLQRKYYMLRFTQKFDVLDVDRTIFAGKTDFVVRASFLFSKINIYSFFTKPFSHDLWKITPSLYVNESVREAILEAQLTGISFEKARVS
jgi:hypothetical protein